MFLYFVISSFFWIFLWYFLTNRKAISIFLLHVHLLYTHVCSISTTEFLNIKILNCRISCSFFFCISFRIELNTQIKHIRKCHLFSRFTFFLFLVCSWWEEKCILLVEFQLMCCEIMKFIAAIQPKFNMLFNFIEVLEYYGLLSIVSMAKIKVHFYRFDIRPNDFCKNNFSEQLFVTYTYILHRIESVWSGDTLHISNPPFKR